MRIRSSIGQYAGTLTALVLLALSNGAVAQEYYAPQSYNEPANNLPAGSVEAQLEHLQSQMEMLQQELAYVRSTASYDTSSTQPHPAPPPPPAPKVEVPKLKFPSITINGVFQADMGFFNQDDTSHLTYGDLQDGADFRRARLSAKGSVTETVNYFFQMDFGFFGRPTFTDVWMESTDHPLLGNIRIGQWKQPFSLEVVSSFRYTTFMERSLLFQAFTPFRHLGVGFYNHSDNLNWTWAASGFRSGQDQFGGSVSDNGGWGTSERVTFLPWYDETSGGRGYLHLGAGHYLSMPPNHIANFRTIPEMFIGENAAGAVGTSGTPAPGAFNGTPFFVKTGPLLLDNFNVLGSELLFVHGAFSFQTEAMVCYADQQNGSTAMLPGMYAQVGYFLTGEHRPYDRKAGAIDRIIPFENFFHVSADDGTCTGWGAWEVAGRVSTIDLNDGVVRGGSMTDLTVGVNWYLNPYTKLVFNHINAQVNDPTFGQSTTGITAFRAQIDF